MEAVETEVTAWIEGHAEVLDENVRRQVVRNRHLPSRTILTGVEAVEVTQPRVHDRRPAGKLWAGNLHLSDKIVLAVVIERQRVLATEKDLDRPPIRWFDRIEAATSWEKLPEKYRRIAELARSAEAGLLKRPPVSHRS